MKKVTTTPMTYLQRISQGSEEKKQQQLVNTAERAKLQAQADILETRSKVAQLQSELEDLKSSSKLSLPKIVEKQGELDSYVQGLQILENLFAELF